MTFDDLVRRFDATPSGAGYMARCPVHEDDKPSVSISRQGDKILIKCHAGCETEDVVRAKNLTMKDLFFGSNGNRTSVVATYEYRDAGGTVRYRKQRYADKQFFFAKPDGRGGWIASAKENGGKPVLGGVARLPYRLDDLREQVEGSSEVFRVYVVEGEKDVDRLWSLGLPATTNDAGAGKWKDTYAQQLKDVGATEVVCIPDDDDPGRLHMQAVAASCHAAGLTVRLVELPGEHPKGYDVSDWLDDGHDAAKLLALCAATAPYVPPNENEMPEVESPPAAVPVAYAFAHAFSPDHFVTTWINHFSQQCDAALEFHEAAALVSLAAATPTLTARTSGSADGLRTNLYILLVGDPGRSRKSTAKDYAIQTVRHALPNVLLPEQMTQESFVESLTHSNGGSALWAIDEFTDTLSKIVNATYLAGMRGLLLELYARTDYTYRRVSKSAKKQEDHFAVRNVALSLIGCATPTIFQNLDGTAVGSGLLTRFAIVMPEGKPSRLPQFELTDDPIPARLVKWLHDVSLRTTRQTVTFLPGVLERLDDAVDKPLDESADRCQMTVRMGVMARKVAILSAAGREGTFELEGAPLTVGLADAEAAIQVVSRWIAYAQAFEARTEESSFEVKVQRCIAIVKGRTINRREVARKVHVSAKELLEIEKTLEQREQVEVLQSKPPTGRPSTMWRWLP